MPNNKRRDELASEYRNSIKGRPSYASDGFRAGYDAAFAEAEAKIDKLEAKLWIAKDFQLRTYDGLAQKADKYDEAQAEIDQLNEDLQTAYDVMNNDKSIGAILNTLIRQRDEQTQRADRLEAALKFYADRFNHATDRPDEACAIELDGGDLARKALKPKE